MSTTVERNRKTVHEMYDEWRSSFNSRSYMLARMTAEEMIQVAPDSAEVHFITGLTYVALRNFRAAQKEFQATADALQSGRGGETFLPREVAGNVGPVTLRCLEGLESKKLTWAPSTALTWLRNPETVGDVISKPAIGVGGELIGRVEPLVDLANGKPLGSRPYKPIGGVLSEEIIALTIDRPTMRDLLGKDADIKIDRYDASIDRAPITIIDDSIKIMTGDIHIRTEHEKLIDESIKIIDDSIRIDRDYLSDEERKRREETERKAREKRRELDERKMARFDPSKPLAGVAAPPPPKPAQKPRVESRPQTHAAGPPPPKPVAKPIPKTQKVAAATAAATAATAAATAAAAAASAKATGAAQKASAAVDEWTKWEQDVESLVRVGNYTEAIDRIEAAVQRFPKSSRLQEILAETLEHSGRKDQAAVAWAETVRKAMAAGSRERAERALKNAAELARENADLLHDLAGLAAGLASLGLAATLGKMAADVYRRRNDRPKLLALLRTLRGWGVEDSALENELGQLEKEDSRASPAPTKNAPPPPPQFSRTITSDRAPSAIDDYERVKPPTMNTSRGNEREEYLKASTPPPQPPQSTNDPASRVSNLDLDALARKAAAQKTETFDIGIAFMFVSLIIMIGSLLGLPFMVPLIFLIILNVISKAQESLAASSKEAPKSNATMKVARAIAVFALVVSFVRCLG